MITSTKYRWDATVYEVTAAIHSDGTLLRIFTDRDAFEAPSFKGDNPDIFLVRGIFLPQASFVVSESGRGRPVTKPEKHAKRARDQARRVLTPKKRKRAI